MANISELQKTHTSSDIAKMKPKDQVKALIAQNRQQIVDALPSHVRPDRMLQVALSAVLTTPALLDCYTPSLFGALVKCTQLGLEPNNPLGHAHLVPFKNRKQNRTDVQLMIGYKGFINLARRSGDLESISANCVYEGDEFSYEYGTNAHLTHIPKDLSDNVTHSYCFATFKDGGYAFKVLTRDAINKIMLTKTQSRGQYGPWKDDFPAMARKSAIRSLAQGGELPMEIELAEAVAIDQASDAGQTQNMDRVLDGEFSVMEAVDEVSTEETGAPVDSNGEIFDAKLHAVDADGMPVTRADGAFKLKTVKKPAKKTTKKAATPKAPPTADDVDPFADDDFDFE